MKESTASIVLHKGVLGSVIFLLVPVVLFLLLTSRTSLIAGIRSFDVLTGSMEPTVHVGSMVFTKPLSTYSIGQIITFNRGTITVTHRVAGMGDGGYITKGDANKTADPQIVRKIDVVGQDFVIVPYLGRVTSFVKTPIGFFILIVIPTILFIIFEAKTIKEEFEKDIERKVLKKMQPAGEI